MPVYFDNRTKKYYFKCSIHGRQFLRRGFVTKKEAREAEVIFMYENKEKKKKRKEVVITWYELIKLYLKNYKQRVKITVYKDMERELNNNLYKVLPNIDVRKLVYSDFQKAREKIKSLPICIKGQNRKINRIKSIFEFLKTFYKIDCPDVQMMMPIKDYTIKKETLKRKVITYEEFQKIYYLSDDYYKLLFLTLYLFGIRIGELMGLKVDAIDFNEKLLQIYQAISWKTGTGTFVAITPKTKASKRFFHLTDSYIAMLKKHIQTFDLSEKDYIFFSRQNGKDKPISENAIRNAFSRCCKEAGLPFKTQIHLFRHTNASMLYDKGLSEEEIQKFEGHESVKTTKEFYLHQTDARIERSLKIVEKMIKDL